MSQTKYRRHTTLETTIAGADASSEGVQRDLLPIIEGSVVTTKHGNVNTDHILFICSGAFHSCKPSDMLAELQGRLPVRVELKGLTCAPCRPGRAACVFPILAMPPLQDPRPGQWPTQAVSRRKPEHVPQIGMKLIAGMSSCMTQRKLTSTLCSLPYIWPGIHAGYSQ